MTVETQVLTYQVDYKCDECKIGFMRPTGLVYDSYPPRFPHECNHCGLCETFQVQYPYTYHKPVEK